MKSLSRPTLAVIVAAAAMACAGCASSPPLRLYVLTPTMASNQTSDAMSSGGLRIDRVVIPGELDRPQILRRVGSNQLAISEQDHWAAPLDEMIRRVLNEDLAQRQGSEAAQSLGRSLALDLRELAVEPDCSVTLRAAWIMATPGTRGIVSLRSTGERGATTDKNGVASCPAAAVPAAMSAALAQLSEQLVKDTSKAAGSPAGPG